MTEFEQIYRTYFGRVYRYICKLSGDEMIAEEITSETFFRAMHAIGSFRGDCDISVWLCQIAKNCYFTHLKKQKLTEPMDDAALSALENGDASPEERYINQDDAARIRAVLHSVQATYKEVFMWRVFAELSFRQIGQLFGKTENWACVTYHRAKAIIQSRLEEPFHEK